VIEPLSWENVTGVDLLELRLRDELRWSGIVVQVLGIDRFDWRATENAALHLRVYRGRFVTIEA
jgi:hypothetical protein